jgi:hypothetical protein
MADALQHTSRRRRAHTNLCASQSHAFELVDGRDRKRGAGHHKYSQFTYSEPNLTPEKIQARGIKRDDPLLDFSTICRRELESQWKGL